MFMLLCSFAGESSNSATQSRGTSRNTRRHCAMVHRCFCCQGITTNNVKDECLNLTKKICRFLYVLVVENLSINCYSFLLDGNCYYDSGL